MKPDKPGIWEWFEEDGTKRLVSVVNTEHNASLPPSFCVFWWGGYYTINDERNPSAPEWDWATKAEWPDRWGNYVGPNDMEADLYWMPTPEQFEKIMKAYEDRPVNDRH